MKRVLLGIALSALVFGVAFAGAKVATVTNPMSADLNGGGYRIGNVESLDAASGQFSALTVSGNLQSQNATVNDLTLGNPSQPGYPGFLDISNGSGDGHSVTVTAGVESPVGRIGTPGLYIQDLGDGSAAVWAKTGTDANGWTRLTP